MRRGFTLVELIITIAILALLATVGFIFYSSYQRHIEMEITAQQIVDTLREAQNKAIAGEDGVNWGVHFENDEFVLFYGSTYNPGDPRNQVNSLSPVVEIDDITLNGGGDNVVFERLSGTTSNYGTGTGHAALQVELVNQPSVYKTIIITPEGEIDSL